MGFNKKSDAGPYEGITGQQRYMSDVLYGYYPLLIPALDYNLFGCNAIFTEPSFKIHEAYGVNTTLEKGMIQPIQTLSFELDELDSDYNVAHDPTAFSTQLTYGMLTLSIYNYVDDTGNYSVNNFEMPDIAGILGATGTIQLLNMPVIYPWKFHKIIKSGTDEMAFAGHQLNFPILYDKTTTVFKYNTIGNDVVRHVLCKEYQEPNSALSAKQAMGINTKYLYGETTTEFSSTARWSTPNDDATHHIRGVKLNFNNSGTTPFMLTLVAGPSYPSGIALVKVPNNTTVTLYAGSSYSDTSSVQYAYGFMSCQDPAAIITDIENFYFNGTFNGSNTITNATENGAALLYYICENHIANATDIESYSDSLALVGVDSTFSKSDYVTWLGTKGVNQSFNPLDVNANEMGWMVFKVFNAIAYAKASDASWFQTEIYLPRFTSNCTAEIGALDITEYGEDRSYGYVYADTSVEYFPNTLPRGFSDIELIFEDSIPTMVSLTIGMYSDEWTSQGSSPGWRDVSIVTGNVSDISNDITSYDAYQITLPSTATYIVDPVLYANKFMTVVECSVFSYAGAVPKYTLNNMLSGVADDFTATPASYSYSGIAVLNQDGNNTTSSVIYISNLSGVNKEISNPTIRSIISISELYDLTLVKYNQYSQECYFGILNTETNRHYTPHNMFNCNTATGYSNLIYTETPIVTSVKVIQSNPYSISIIVKLDHNGTSSAVYMTLKQIKTIKGAVFIKDPIHLDSYILESYHISIDNSVIQSEYPLLDNVGTNLGLCLYENAGIKKDIYPIEYDNNIVSVNDTNKHSVRLNLSSIICLPSFNLLDSAIINIADISDFASNAIKIPMLYPHEGLSIVSDDIGNDTYAAVSGSTDGEKILNICYYATRLMNYNPRVSVNIGGKARNLYTGSMIIGTLPGIDKNIKNYSVLPEKTNNLFKVSDIRLLDTVGFDYYPAFDKSFVTIRDNLFLSSRANLIPADYYGLFTLQGTIYGFGSYYLVTDNRQTFVYAITEAKVPTLIKAVDGVAICNPVTIGEDLIIVCTNAIHSLKYGNIYNFEFAMTSAIIKPVTGNGYLLYAYSADVTGDVELVAANGDILTANNGDILSVTSQLDNIKCYNINDRLSVIELDYVVDTNDPNELKIIENNCYGNRLTVYQPEPGGSYSYKPSAYAMIESGNYHTAPYIISEPMQLRNQKAEVVIVDAVFMYCKGQGQIEFRLYNGDVAIVDKTITITTSTDDKVTENKIEVGMIPYDNLYYRVDIIPVTYDTTPKIEMIKFRINNLQEP